MKTRTQYRCTKCGYVSIQWFGRCPNCESWNTLEEEEVPVKEGHRSWILPEEGVTPATPVPLSQVPMEDVSRIATGIQEVDRVLGGGLVPGSFLIVSGDPGVGKSTLLLQMAGDLARQKDRRVLYVSGEESPAQVRLRAERLGVLQERVFLLAETDIRRILHAARKIQPSLVVVDSIQTVLDPDVPAAPGSVTQVRECGTALLQYAKQYQVTVIAVGHVTKEGNLAGPRTLEHMVDGVFYLEGDAVLGLRVLRAVKNRFGPTSEIGMLEMTGEGFRELPDATAYFVDLQQEQGVGVAVTSLLEGQRAFLVEIQALVTPTPFPVPQRTVTGFDPKRLAMLLAIADRYLGTELRKLDVFLQVLGGFRIQETAADLAILMALLSAYRRIPLPARTLFLGELDLSGTVRTIPGMERRLKEAQRVGFTRAYLPPMGKRLRIRGLRIRQVRSFQEVAEDVLA